MITLTDAERAFADSGEGKLAIAHEQSKHRMREAHKGANAQPWTDSMTADAARKGAVAKARLNLTMADQAARMPGLAATEHAARETARVMREDALRNGYKRQG